MPSDFFVLFLFLLGQLQIAESEESDQGKYECVAKNEVGSQYSYSAQLYVRGKYLNKKRKRNVDYGYECLKKICMYQREYFFISYFMTLPFSFGNLFKIQVF